MQRRITRQRLPRLIVPFFMMFALLGASLPGAAGLSTARAEADTYTNPLKPVVPGDGIVENCADPTVLRSQTSGDNHWYMFCTTDPLNDEDRNAAGEFNFRPIPMLRSLDLVNWVYVNDAFDRPGDDAEPDRPLPTWAEPTAGFWAPELTYFNNQYYLYYVVTDVKPEVSGAPDCNGDSAIGVATSSSPIGPWTHTQGPIIEPRYNGDPALEFGQRQCNFFWTFDPEVIQEQDEYGEYNNGQRYIYFGSYYGGIHVRELSADGMMAPADTNVRVAIPNRYEAPEVIQRGGYYYMFVSASNCCNGAVTGYSVFAGRSMSPLGPFVDREGVPLDPETHPMEGDEPNGYVGGTPVLLPNGNRWIGPGHNTVFQDFDGQWWTIYHAVDRTDPYFENAVGIMNLTKRPALLDPLDWVDGWPTVRGGLWASDEPMPAPAAQPGDTTDYDMMLAQPDVPDDQIEALSDEFNNELGDQWSWVREPGDAATYGVENGTFRFNTQDADIYQDNNTASLLVEDTPEGDYVVETKVKLNLPPAGCSTPDCRFIQAGLVIYGNDDNYVRLMQVAIFETRQIEFAKEFVDPFLSPPAPHFGGIVQGPAAETTWLRIVKRTINGEEHYRAYTSRDGQTWIRGGVWTHNLGGDAKIGLASMGGPGYTANFDYVRVYDLANTGRTMQYRIWLPMAPR